MNVGLFYVSKSNFINTRNYAGGKKPLFSLSD